MLPNHHRKLADSLRQGLGMNKARAECFASAAIGAIETKSVRLSDLAPYVPGQTLVESKYRRLQYFFEQLEIDYNALAKFNMGLLKDVIGDKPLVLAIDRTNWEARKNDVNLLVLSACLGDAAQPLLWTDLRRKGNSDTRQRRRLMRRFLKLFGLERIGALVADREFVGKDWFSWLQREQVPFAVRLRENFKTRPVDGKKSKDAKDYFSGLRPGESLDLGLCEVCGVRMGVCGLRLKKDNELLVIGYWGMDANGAQDVFMKRWNIETGFEKLKSHGFDMEASRLRGGGKMERLMAVLSVGFAWCYAMGAWSVGAIKPIRFIRKLGRRARSLFSRGLELLIGLFHGTGPALRRVSYRATMLLRRGCSGFT
jgi:hypothetical protein